MCQGNGVPRIMRGASVVGIQDISKSHDLHVSNNGQIKEEMPIMEHLGIIAGHKPGLTCSAIHLKSGVQTTLFSLRRE